MAIHWGNSIGPLFLAANDDLPRASHNFFTKFNGYGKVSANEHIAAFFAACSVIFPQYEDVVVIMFIETLVENAYDWFQHLPLGCMISWDDMRK